MLLESFPHKLCILVLVFSLFPIRLRVWPYCVLILWLSFLQIYIFYLLVLFCRFLKDSISFILNIAFVFVFFLDVGGTSVLVIVCVIFCAFVMLLVLESWFMLILSCCVFTEVAWMTDEVWAANENLFTSCLVSFPTFLNTKYCRQNFCFLNSKSTKNQMRHCITTLLSKKLNKKNESKTKQGWVFSSIVSSLLLNAH